MWFDKRFSQDNVLVEKAEENESGDVPTMSYDFAQLR